MAARSGAPAHAKTITELLTNQFFKADGKPTETPPDVLFWALKAAENLLAASDPCALGTPNAARHTVQDEDLVPLVRALNDIVLKNPPGWPRRRRRSTPTAASRRPAGRPRPRHAEARRRRPPPRRSQTEPERPRRPSRSTSSGTSAGRRSGPWASCGSTLVAEGTPTRSGPAFTLAQVAVSDVSLNPPPSVTEVGEAVIGLCKIHPSPNLNVDALLLVIAYGTGRFFALKAEEARGQDAAVEGVRGAAWTTPSRCSRRTPRPTRGSARSASRSANWPASSPAT